MNITAKHLRCNAKLFSIEHSDVHEENALGLLIEPLGSSDYTPPDGLMKATAKHRRSRCRG